jgi:hypothetical protein
MTNKKYLVTLVLLVCLVSLDCLAQEGQYRYADATQLWRLTGNAAGLSLDSSANRGYAQFDLQHHEGDYRRVQEGGQRNQLEFYTERYQKISPLLVGYGSFRFDMNRTKDRAWCDVMRPYNSNPFFSGSSVSGKYDTQQFDLTAAVGTIQMWGFTGGLRLDYSVGDLSRLRDPRSRSELLDYKLSPSLTYSTGNHTLGIAGHYNRRKEKIPSMTTVQQDPDLKYYLMTGMEQATGTIGGYSGYNREWVDHRFGAELSYGYDNGNAKSLNSVTIERGSEDVLGTYKYEPGHYVSYRYGLASHNRLRTSGALHQIDLTADYQQAYADEYRQQLQQERDADKGYTSYWYETLITFKKRYQVKQLNAELHYRYNTVDGAATVPAASPAGITSYIGAKASLHQTENKRLLPTSSLEYTHLDFAAEAGKAFLSNRLWIDVEAGYHAAPKADLQLANATTDYAVQVLLPDMQYYDANYWHGHLAVTYQFPLSLKGMRNIWFVRAYGDYLSADHSLNGSTIGLTFGLFN